jgi:hypothetical protein
MKFEIGYVNHEMEIMWKEAVVTEFKKLFWNLLEGLGDSEIPPRLWQTIFARIFLPRTPPRNKKQEC